MNREEAKKLAEEQRRMLEGCFSKVWLFTGENVFYCSIEGPDGQRVNCTTRFPFESCPPKGEVCEVWDDGNINSDDDDRFLCLSMGDGLFTPYTNRENALTAKWDNWRSLGVNIYDK